MRDILIVIDMQNDFIDGSLGTSEAVSIVSHVAEEMRKPYSKVYLTMDTHNDNYLQTSEGKFLPVEHCIKNTEGWKLCDSVNEALKDIPDYEIYLKPTFGCEELAKRLKEDNEEDTIDSITLVGLCTDICVVSNALLIKAALPETPIRVLKECCAGVTVDSHEAALTTMKMCQIVIE